MPPKLYTFVASLQFEAYSQESAEQMLQDYLEYADTGLEYPDSWALDPLSGEDMEDEDD